MATVTAAALAMATLTAAALTAAAIVATARWGRIAATGALAATATAVAAAEHSEQLERARLRRDTQQTRSQDAVHKALHGKVPLGKTQGDGNATTRVAGTAGPALL